MCVICSVLSPLIIRMTSPAHRSPRAALLPAVICMERKSRRKCRDCRKTQGLEELSSLDLGSAAGLRFQMVTLGSERPSEQKLAPCAFQTTPGASWSS